MLVTQSCLTLHNPLDCSPPGSSVHGILQARILEWVVMLSRGSPQPRDRTQVSCIAGRFFTIWATREVQEYWSGLPCPSLRDLPDPGIEPKSPALQMDSLPAEPQGKPKNTEVGSLSLLQQVFPTRESNWGLLCFRRGKSSVNEDVLVKSKQSQIFSFYAIFVCVKVKQVFFPL